MKSLTVSLAMATFNGARYINEQLESFSAQTRLPDELIICDDGSSDSTLLVIEEYKKRAPFAVEIHHNNQNVGYVKNFEKAMSLCSGDVVFLSDQDDVWMPSKIETVTKIFNDNPEVFVVMNDLLIANGDLSKNGPTQLTNMKRFGMGSKGFITGCSSAHRKRWQELVLPIPEEAPAHDNWVNGIAHELGVVLIIDKPLQLYRRHASNSSNHLFSSNHRITPMDRLLYYGLRDATSSWAREVGLERAKVARLKGKMDFIESLGLRDEADVQIRMAEARCGALNMRLSAFRESRIGRWRAIWRMWQSGAYRELAGWKSAVKDAIRPGTRV